MAIRNIFFDLDGTLVDSIRGIEHSFQKAIDIVLPGRRIPSLHGKIGPPVSEILIKNFPELSEESRDQFLYYFRKIYDQEGWQKVNLYPGVEFVLKRLARKNISCYLVTNKPTKPTHSILDYFEIGQYFQEVVSPNSRMPGFKSKSESVAYLLSKHRLDNQQTIFVGDTTEDYNAAKENCLSFIGVEYGYGQISSESVRDPNCSLTISDFAQLLSLIEIDPPIN